MYRALVAVVQAMLAGLIVLLAYGGAPLALLGFSLLGELIALPEEERVVEYMASMSLTPYPDPSAEVKELSAELLEPPSNFKSTTKETPQKPTEAPPPAATSAKGRPVPVVEAPPPSGSDAERSGGKVRGPTQDGEGRKKQDCLPDNPAITRVSSTRARVKQELVDYYTSHLIEAQSLANTHWLKKDGENYGFRILRVRCGNDLYQLGFRGGDAVIAVNDEPITSLPQAIRAYQKLRSKKRLRVDIRRNNKPMTLEFVLE